MAKDLASMLGDLKFKHQGGHSHLEAKKKHQHRINVAGEQKDGNSVKKKMYISYTLRQEMNK